MKKFLVSLMVFTLVLTDCFAQNGNYFRPPSIGISFFFNDFITPERIRSGSLSQVLREKQWAELREMGPGLAISYIQGLSNHVDFAGTVAGSFTRVPLPGQASRTEEHFLLEGDASLNLKMLSDRYIFTPYLIAGAGASSYNGKFAAFMPLGGGVKVNFFDEAALFVTSQYRVPVTSENTNYHFLYSIGFSGVIGKKKEQPLKEVVIPQQPKDTDNDSIPDDRDKCPQVAGVAKYEGCPVPDSDSDGVNDENDKCPQVAGSARYDGCPIPDSDRDGINDEEDKCKDQHGVAKYQGCPVPDSDSDGVNDENDKCPQVPGTAENAGCPAVSEEVVKKVEYAARNIYFNTGSAKLLSKSFAPLNEVVKILNEDANLKLSIEGHTDNVGKDDYNHTLSHNRAQSVKDYLVSKGIDESRISSEGFGETQPVADNNTAAGRAQNRRVVMKVAY
jgi:outer membrane protein OmpA-like peptidoglycan-associated protein